MITKAQIELITNGRESLSSDGYCFINMEIGRLTGRLWLERLTHKQAEHIIGLISYASETERQRNMTAERYAKKHGLTDAEAYADV